MGTAKAYIPVPMLSVHQAADRLSRTFKRMLDAISTRGRNTQRSRALSPNATQRIQELAFPPLMAAPCHLPDTISVGLPREMHLTPILPSEHTSAALLSALWRASRLDAHAWRDAAVRGTSMRYENAELERRHEDRDLLDRKKHDLDTQVQHARDEAR